jgi:photosystem II stability/assembly factor-like uncharacterized protein
MPWISVSAALLLLLSACTAPPAASIPTTAPPSGTAIPTPTASPTASAAPTAAPITLPTTAQLSAAASNIVWALVAGNRMFSSTDRGATWEEHRATRDFIGGDAELAFLDEREGWLLLAGSPGTQCQFQSVSLAHTTDAGIGWEALIVGAARVKADVLANAQCKRGFVMVDTQRGFVGAWDPNGPPVIYRTADGGRTWSASQPLPDPPGFTTTGAGIALRAGRVRAFGTTLLVNASGQLNGRVVSYVFRSSDGGASWTYLARVPDGEGALALISATRWIRISAPTGSVETNDGGATWHAFTTDYSQAAPIAPDIVFADGLVGYATVRGAIQRTVDGGAHWTSIKTPGT